MRQLIIAGLSVLAISPAAWAGEVTACNVPDRPAVVIRLSESVGLAGESSDATAARRLKRTLDRRPEIDAASCVTIQEEALPSSAIRHAWRVKGDRVIVDPEARDPDNPRQQVRRELRRKLKAGDPLTDEEVQELVP